MGQGQGWTSLLTAAVPEFWLLSSKAHEQKSLLDTVMVTEVIPSGSAALGPEAGWGLEGEGVMLVNQYQAHNFTYTISLDSHTNPVRQWP